MKILRRIPTTIAVIGVMVIVASCQTPATDLTTLEATPDKFVLSYSGSINPIEKLLDGKFIEEAGRLAAEHCKKFDTVASLPDALTQPGPPSIVLTFYCDGKNKLKTGEGITAGKNVKTPTLRDKPDKDLCQAFPYGNPDFAKEAERRELTEKKCKEILRQ